MALNRYVLTANVTLPSGAYTADSNGFGEGSYAQSSGEYGSGAGGTAGSTTWLKGQVIWADPTGVLYAAIGAGNLRAWVDGQDVVGHAALAN